RKTCVSPCVSRRMSSCCRVWRRTRKASRTCCSNCCTRFWRKWKARRASVATLVTEQGIVHYEAHGRGRPVLLLHGWLGSWALWHNTILELGKEFRTYALDFWGFGESGDQGVDFSVDNFVLLVNQFLD